MTYEMPTIDLSNSGLTGRDLEIAQACLNKGKLRATFKAFTGDNRANRETLGEARYVWRMVAFFTSPNYQHQCMPVSADFDLPSKYWPTHWEMGTITKDGKKYYVHCRRDENGQLKTVGKAIREQDAKEAHERRRVRIAELQVIIDAMCDCIPPNEWHGVKRWGRALGHL